MFYVGGDAVFDRARFIRLSQPQTNHVNLVAFLPDSSYCAPCHLALKVWQGKTLNI